MMDFIGKICPYCKTELKEEDDVVVCSICEMPHHKECWIENKACTTFGCTGTIDGVDQSTENVEHDRFCANCGASLSEGQKFCASCGTPVGTMDTPATVYNNSPVLQQQPVFTQPNTQYTPPQPQYGGQQYNNGYNQYTQTSDQDLYTFVASNQHFYLEKFQRMQITNSKVSWNWCSFLFGGFWLAFRKMYGLAAAYIGISFVSQLIPGLGMLLSLALWICMGIFGNYLYKNHIDNELQFAKSMDSLNKSAYIAKKGGTSMAAIFVIVGISFLVGLIIGSV